MTKKKLTEKQRQGILVYNLDLAKELMDLDYKVVDIEYNTNNPGLLVFFFENVPGIKKDLQRIVKQKRENC